MGDEPKWIWHNTSSVEFSMVADYSAITSNTEVQTVQQIYSVRLYRDSPESPWKNNANVTPRERTVVSSAKHTEEQIRAMRNE